MAAGRGAALPLGVARSARVWHDADTCRSFALGAPRRTTVSDRTFVTVHDLGLSVEEDRVWGGLPSTPEAYPSLDGMTPHDSALAHVVAVCMERQDYASARRYAVLITDPKMRAVRLGLISSEGPGWQTTTPYRYTS